MACFCFGDLVYIADALQFKYQQMLAREVIAAGYA